MDLLSHQESSTCRKADDFAFQQFWLSNEGLTSELKFHNKLYCVVHEAGESYRANKLPQLRAAIERLLWVDDYIVSEPLLSIYESGLVNAFLYLVHACADRYLIDAGYSLIERCQNLLVAKRERRSQLAFPPRPDSECWYRILGLLAELKWKGTAANRNRLLAPEQLVAEYFSVAQRCLDYIKNSPSRDPQRDERVVAGLGWYGLQVVKMTVCWCPHLQEETIQRYNSVHGDILHAETGHFMIYRHNRRSNPWYWDLELFKWCVRGPGSVDEAFLCHQWRLDSARNQGMPQEVMQAYRNASDRELMFLLDRREQPEAYAVS